MVTFSTFFLLLVIANTNKCCQQLCGPSCCCCCQESLSAQQIQSYHPCPDSPTAFSMWSVSHWNDYIWAVLVGWSAAAQQQVYWPIFFLTCCRWTIGHFCTLFSHWLASSPCLAFLLTAHWLSARHRCPNEEEEEEEEVNQASDVLRDLLRRRRRRRKGSKQ